MFLPEPDRKVTFIRHGKTDKVKPDSARRLTDEGKAQAARRRELMGNPTFDIGLCSPAERTRETLKIIAGNDDIMVGVLSELLFDEESEDGKHMTAAFNRIDYASANEYVEKCSDEERSALARYASTAYRALTNLLAAGKSRNVIVVGHAVLLGFLMAAMAPSRDELKSLNIGECEGAELSFDENGTCTYVKLHVG